VVSTVWADRSDRLARDLFETRAFFALCARSGTAWRFWSEPWLNSDAPEAEELRQRAAFDAEMESRRIGSRLRRHYAHAAQQGLPRARRSPLGLRLEGSGDGRRYVLDDRPLVAGLTVADAARRLVELYLKAGSIWTAVATWKSELREAAGKTPEGVLEPMLKRCLALNHESARGWLELCAAELGGHTTANRYERIEPESGSGKARYKRLPWDAWQLTRDTHPALVDAATGRRVLRLLAENAEKGRAIARRRSSDPERMPSFTAVAFCSCGRRLRQQSTRAGKKASEPAHRTLRCAGARRAVGLCDQPGISERRLCYELLPLLVVTGPHRLSCWSNCSRLGGCWRQQDCLKLGRWCWGWRAAWPLLRLRLLPMWHSWRAKPPPQLSWPLCCRASGQTCSQPRLFGGRFCGPWGGSRYQGATL
jgi:hypothetical protein